MMAEFGGREIPRNPEAAQRVGQTKQDWLEAVHNQLPEKEISERAGSYHDALQAEVMSLIETGVLSEGLRDPWFCLQQARTYVEAKLRGPALEVVDEALNGPVAFDPEAEVYRDEFERLRAQLLTQEIT